MAPVCPADPGFWEARLGAHPREEYHSGKGWGPRRYPHPGGGRVPVLGGDSGLGALTPATELALEAGKVLAEARQVAFLLNPSTCSRNQCCWC